MTFSAGFLTAIVYLSLTWCAVSALALAALLIRDSRAGDIW